MTFFTDKWTIGRVNQKDLILVRKSKSNIFLERISEFNKGDREILATDALEEFDVSLRGPDTIYILYQNIEGHLILYVLKDDKKEEVRLTPTGLTEVFNLTLQVKDKSLHILYTIRGNDNKYRIYHHFYDGGIWKDYIVDEIEAKKVINPMKALIKDDKLSLVYYSNDKDISYKVFNVEKEKWGISTKLVEGGNEKLFLDSLIVEDHMHLSFCEYIDGNLVVRYIRYNVEDENYEKTMEDFISNEGSPSHPTLIYFRNQLWLVWLELNKLFSRSSIDHGQTWGPIYMWNETRNIDFLRYKYITASNEENIQLDYSFGSIYPDIRFLGFGPTNKAVEVPLKKKTNMKFYSPYEKK